MRIKLVLKEGIGWILWFIRGGEITLEKVCLAIPSSFVNKGSTAKDLHPEILSIWIIWLFSKGRYNKTPQSSMPLDITQDTIGCLCFRRILSGYSGCMLSSLCEDTRIRFPRGITSVIHGLRTWGCKIFSYYGMRLPRLNLICYLLLCSIILQYWDIEIISNPVNILDHPAIEKKR